MITTLVDIIALSECNEDDAVLKLKLTMHGYKKIWLLALIDPELTW